MSFFEEVEELPPDPILGLNSAFKEDTRDNKVNLGVGAYKTAELKPLVFSTVRKVEKELVEQSNNKEYLPIAGDAGYIKAALQLIYGQGVSALEDGTIIGAQSLGGTGALRVLAELFSESLGKQIFLSQPSWANHKPIFHRAGLQTLSYPYYDGKKHDLVPDQILAALSKMPEGSIILFHACCHNPTGMDPSMELWKEISAIVKARKLFPFFDFAYQGFGQGLEEDAAAIRYFQSQGHEMAVAQCFSKNLGLYGERIGTLSLQLGNPKIARAMLSQVKRIIRSNYSNPPLHGAQIVKNVLGNEEHKKAWTLELSRVRERLGEMRRALAAGLLAKGGARDFSFLHKQTGMFSFCGLDREQVQRLRGEYGIFIPSNGRINVAGLSPHKNLEYVVDAVVSVL